MWEKLASPLETGWTIIGKDLITTADSFLYQHFCWDGYSEDDIAIMPIEEVFLRQGENINLHGVKEVTKGRVLV